MIISRNTSMVILWKKISLDEVELIEELIRLAMERHEKNKN